MQKPRADERQTDAFSSDVSRTRGEWGSRLEDKETVQNK